MKDRIRSFFIKFMHFHWMECIAWAVGLLTMAFTFILMNFVFKDETVPNIVFALYAELLQGFLR